MVLTGKQDSQFIQAFHFKSQWKFISALYLGVGESLEMCNIFDSWYLKS